MFLSLLPPLYGKMLPGKSGNDDNMRNVDEGDCEEGDDEEGAVMNFGHVRKTVNPDKTLEDDLSVCNNDGFYRFWGPVIEFTFILISLGCWTKASKSCILPVWCIVHECGIHLRQGWTEFRVNLQGRRPHSDLKQLCLCLSLLCSTPPPHRPHDKISLIITRARMMSSHTARGQSAAKEFFFLSSAFSADVLWARWGCVCLGVMLQSVCACVLLCVCFCVYGIVCIFLMCGCWWSQFGPSSVLTLRRVFAVF